MNKNNIWILPFRSLFIIYCVTQSEVIPTVKWANLKPKELENAAADRSGWRTTVIRAAANFERDRSLAIPEVREQRKRVLSKYHSNIQRHSMPNLQLHMYHKLWASEPHACSPLTLYLFIDKTNHFFLLLCVMLKSFSLSRDNQYTESDKSHKIKHKFRTIFGIW